MIGFSRHVSAVRRLSDWRWADSLWQDVRFGPAPSEESGTGHVRQTKLVRERVSVSHFRPDFPFRGGVGGTSGLLRRERPSVRRMN